MSSKMKTTATKEEAASALVPKLRFPEFRGADEWSDEVLSGVATIVMGSSPKSECYNQSEIGLPLLQGNADIKNRLSAPRIFTSEITKECSVGDILLSVRAPVGSVAKSVHHACIGRGIAAIQSRQPNSQEFLYQWLLSYEPRWVNISQGGTFDAINSDDLKQVGLAVPSPAEQQKIAECLSSVDELMAAQARKVDALKTHKKGLMQQLFPREGETKPRLRFPEFQNAREWEEKKLGTVCEIQRGKFSHRPRNDPKFFGGQYPFIQTGDVVKSGGGAVIASQSLNEEGLAVSKLFKPTIVLITIAANIGDTGLLQTEGCFTDSVVGLIPKRDVIPVFLELIMRGQKEYLNKVATTGAQKNINNEILREVSVLLPPVPEQQRIADCLTSLDDLIAAQTQKHEALKTHKKGLMQQLFPSPESNDSTPATFQEPQP
jgi:type I restriction enzyme S subunit